MIGIDATKVFCPNFTVPLKRLIEKHKEKNSQLVIKTKEARGIKRLQHLCASYDWQVIGYQQQGELHYIAITTSPPNSKK